MGEQIEHNPPNPRNNFVVARVRAHTPITIYSIAHEFPTPKPVTFGLNWRKEKAAG